MSPGDQIGRWTIVAATDSPQRFLCRCSCGRESLRYRSQILLLADCKCQCRHAALRSSLHRKHGESVHAGNTPEHRIWSNIRARCLSHRNHAYPQYGGRGITICDRWHAYEAFLSDMGRRPSALHSIDRIDNDGPYSPENCRWATASEQALNRRTARLLTVHGETKPVTQWAREQGIPRNAIFNRLRRGWTHERAVMTPV